MTDKKRRFLPIAAIAAVALVAAACSSGGDDAAMVTPTPTPMVVGKVFPTGTTITLPAGSLDDGTYPASPASEGQSVTVEGVGTFKCNTGPCSVDIANDVITSTGVIEVVSLASDLDPAIVTALAGKAEPKPDPVVPDPALGAAQTAAADAADAADAAADKAEAAADAQIASMAADEASYALARDAAVRARAASDAAAEANTAAQAATTTAAAQRQRDLALEAQKTAEAEQANAETSAGRVADAQRFIDDEAQRVEDVASAREAAMASYVDAADDATDAETAADEAEAAAPGSPGATAAREAATAARTAADAAEAAHEAITDGMTKAEADAKAAEAASAADTANTEYMTAKAENDDIQTQVVTGKEQQRKLDVADARKYGGKAVGAAKKAAEDAAVAASDAKMAADNADAAHTMAMKARTDSAAAKTAADNANAAYMKAKTAAGNANAAYMAAKDAIADVMDDSSSEDAKAARSTAESQQGMAEAGQTTAEAEQGKAEMAETSAMTAAGTHVLELLKAANAYHITEPKADKTVAQRRQEEIDGVGKAMVTATELEGVTPANAKWEADQVKGDSLVEGVLTITVKGVTSDTVGDSTEDPILKPNAKQSDDGGDFPHMFDITSGQVRVIAFTDKKQATAKVPAKTITLANHPVQVSGIVENKDAKIEKIDDLKNHTKYDHDGDPDTLAVQGTYSCLPAGTCQVQVTDGEVVAILGTGTVLFKTVTAQTIVAEVPANDMNDYLAFGVWLKDKGDAKSDFGAFASGGTNYEANPALEVTGTAKYSGPAVGTHHKTGAGVNWFDGTANLTADFDTAAKPGTVEGSIDNIHVGGQAYGDSITLVKTGLAKNTATFSGTAVMGEQTAPGSVLHDFNGNWSGSFFGPTVDDETTRDVNESHVVPLAAAGRFGVARSETTGTGNDAVTTVESFVGAFGAKKQ